MSTLTFSPTNLTTNVNQSQLVDIVLDTQSASVGGVDIVINFDPSKIRIDEFIKGDIFDDYPAVVLDQDGGKAMISGIANSQSSFFNGNGVAATLRFTPLSQGEHILTFNFTPGKTNDSNVAVFTGNGDDLTQVNQLTVSSSVPGQSSVPTSPPAQTNNPHATDTFRTQSTTTTTKSNNSQSLAQDIGQIFNPNTVETNFDLPEDPLQPLQNTQTIQRTTQAQPTQALAPAQKLENKLDTTVSRLPFIPIIGALVFIVILYFFARYFKHLRFNHQSKSIPQPTNYMPTTTQPTTNLQPNIPNPPQTPVAPTIPTTPTPISANPQPTTNNPLPPNNQ